MPHLKQPVCVLVILAVGTDVDGELRTVDVGLFLSYFIFVFVCWLGTNFT